MAAPYSTILLDSQTWDLTTDSNNNIALATAPYSAAQDMATQCRQFQGEYIYNQSDGVPMSSILGATPSLALMKADFIAAAGKVPATSNLKCFIESVVGRNAVGQVQATVTLASGTTMPAVAPITGAHTP